MVCRLMILLLLGATVTMTVPAQACPLCKEAIAASDMHDDDVNNWPKAMNQSIYLMITVPYVSLMLFGYLVYRGLKQNEAYLAKLRADRASEPLADGPIPTPI